MEDEAPDQAKKSLACLHAPGLPKVRVACVRAVRRKRNLPHHYSARNDPHWSRGAPKSLLSLPTQKRKKKEIGSERGKKKRLPVLVASY